MATRQENMQDNSPVPTKRLRRFTETDGLMIDSVRVAPDTFASLSFLGSSERKEYVEGQNIPYNQKKQQLKNGVPVWTVQLAVTTWRNADRARVIKVNIPSHTNPADNLTLGEVVELSNAVYGVTPNRKGDGYSIWMTAEGIAPATTNVRRASAATSVA